jgi:dienelactone hydrolase
VVIAPDFPGDHVSHIYSDDPAIKQRPVDESAEARPHQAASLMEAVAEGYHSFLDGIVDSESMGSFGMSMGGYTALAANSYSTRQTASVAIAPMCGIRSPIPQIGRLGKLLNVDDWKSNVSTFVLTGSVDALVIVDDVRELFDRMPSPKQLLILKDAGHLHWVDNAEQNHETMRLGYLSGQFPDPEIDGPALGKAFRPFSELCPAEHAADTMRAICLSQFRGILMGDTQAQHFLSNDLANTFAARGIAVE